MYNSLVIKESDSVVTVIAPIKAGEEIIYNVDGQEKKLIASTDIPIYHKAALRDIKKGETAEKAIPRELREETKLTAIKWRYYGSRYHEEKDVLMLNFIVTAEEGPVTLKEDELQEVRWCTPAEARELVRKNSTAEYFLSGALETLGKKK